MKNFVLFTAGLELLAGLVLFAVPHLVPSLSGATTAGYTMARMYGAAALAVGYFALQVWRNFGSEDLKKAFLNTFIVFHIGVAVAIFIVNGGSGGAEELAPCVLHTVMAAITIFYAAKK
ncbi:MAG: hypothetical protein AB8B69_17385 [Chitinophagales bacterium]